MLLFSALPGLSKDGSVASMNQFDILFDSAKPFYNNGDPGHDFAHVERVIANCRAIGASAGANLELLLPAALLHDVVNLPKNHPERLAASDMAAKKSAELLKSAGYLEEQIQKIKEIITEHSYSLGKKPSSIESAVLQDADKLDALGAIGIMRTVTCGAKMGSSYYDLNEPFVKTRPLNDKAFTIDHFETKLLKLAALMNTEAGRLEAAKRTSFMKEFLSQLSREIQVGS
jgi:uncharacterized protein